MKHVLIEAKKKMRVCLGAGGWVANNADNPKEHKNSHITPKRSLRPDAGLCSTFVTGPGFSCQILRANKEGV